MNTNAAPEVIDSRREDEVLQSASELLVKDQQGDSAEIG